MNAYTKAPAASVWGAFITCSLIWGSTFLFIAIGNDALPPVWGATLRLVLAGGILLAIATLRKQPLPRGAALRAAAWYGVFMFGINMPLLYWGQQWVPSGIAAVMYATLPLTTPLMARAMGLERIYPLKLAGGAVALAGVMTIFWRQITGDVGFIPMMAVFAAATLAGIGTLMLKRGPRQAPIPANAVGSLVGAVICLGCSFAMGESQPVPTTAGQLVPVLYLAIAGSVGAFTLLAWLVNHMDATNIAFISVLNPIIAITLGVVVRGEQLEATTLMGATLVLIGVVMAVQSDRIVARKAVRAGQERAPDSA
jgi:drug/metabolite transporter (DMT)-like permease